MAEDPKTPEQKRRTVFVLYIPGGGALGIMPLVVLSRIEELLDKYAIEALQGTEGASVGGMTVAAMNIRDPQNPAKPKFSSSQILDHVYNNIGLFFPAMPYRQLKMTTAVSASLLQGILDPVKPAAFVLEDIHLTIDRIKEKAPAHEHAVLEDIRSRACSKWYTKRAQKKSVRLCEEFGKRNPDLSDMAGDLFGLVSTRHTNTPLDIIFKAAANQGAELAKAIAGEFRFDPAVPKKVFQELFGDARLSDSMRTLYISANNRRDKEIKTFSCLKSDLFSLDPATPSITSEGDHKMWDLTLATTANPIGFPPHTTEDGIECDDRAHRHMPLLHYINDILRHKPEDADLKLVVLGTGWYVSRDMDKQTQYTTYAQNPLGDLGYFLEEDNAYTASLQRKALHEILGKENVIEINPRMSPRNQKELDEFPERDILDASPGNIEKLKKRGWDFVREEDKKIKGLAFLLAENMRILGHMNEEEHARAMKNIGTEFELPEPSRTCNGSCEPHSHPEPKKPWNESISSFFSRLFNKKAQEQDNQPEEPKQRRPGKKCGGGPRCG